MIRTRQKVRTGSGSDRVVVPQEDFRALRMPGRVPLPVLISSTHAVCVTSAANEMHNLNFVVGVKHRVVPVSPANYSAVNLDREAIHRQTQGRDQILN